MNQGQNKTNSNDQMQEVIRKLIVRVLRLEREKEALSYTP